jgi:hypothetical protein
MPLGLRHLLLALVALTTVAAAEASADSHTAQIGGGSEAQIRCDGSRLSYQRRGDRSIRLLCRAQGAAAANAPEMTGVEVVALEQGAEMRVLCQGARLKTRRTSRTEMRASCAELI